MSPKSRAAAVSVASNTCLVLMKLAVGLFTGSVSIISEAIHSANDLLAAIIAFISVRTSDKAPDDEHPFGHGKIEAVSGAIESALILLAGAWIIYEAVKKLIQGGEVEHLGAGTAVMLVSTLVNVFVSRYLFAVAKREDSMALEADAHHLATDVYTSLGVSVGLGLVWLTGWHILDPIAAILVAGLIFKIGWDLSMHAGHHLIDRALPDEDLAIIQQLLHKDPRVRDVHRFKTRKSGSDREIQAHIALDAALSFAEAHDIAHDLEQRVSKAFTPPARVLLHPDPVDANNQAAPGGHQ